MSLSMVEEKTPHPEMPVPVYVLGVRVDRYSQRRALDTIEQMLSRYRASGRQLNCQQVITVNTEFVMMAQHDPIFRQCINQATLVVPDGMGIVWATRSTSDATARPGMALPALSRTLALEAHARPPAFLATNSSKRTFS